MKCQKIKKTVIWNLVNQIKLNKIYKVIFFKVKNKFSNHQMKILKAIKTIIIKINKDCLNLNNLNYLS